MAHTIDSGHVGQFSSLHIQQVCVEHPLTRKHPELPVAFFPPCIFRILPATMDECLSAVRRSVRKLSPGIGVVYQLSCHKPPLGTIRLDD